MQSRKVYIISGILLLCVVILGVVLFWQDKNSEESNNNLENSNSMSDNQENQSVQNLANGLIIEDIKVGVGNVIKQGDTVSIHYVGTLEDGSTFDSSLERGQKFTTQIGVGRVIKGWDQGIPEGDSIVGMKEGGERKLIIPADLAYGDRPLPGIPAGSTLIFMVTQPEIVD
ncbi:MAG: FKBP-type peptidyl-prolyl cis-trans isomerase [Patescibacteria group bacterium]